jgi:hypothetical protein
MEFFNRIDPERSFATGGFGALLGNPAFRAGKSSSTTAGC